MILVKYVKVTKSLKQTYL